MCLIDFNQIREFVLTKLGTLLNGVFTCNKNVYIVEQHIFKKIIK